MPVYNGAKYLNEAIDSIINQTVTDFDFLIINDGSIDGTNDILKRRVVTLSYNFLQDAIIQTEEH